ncbi:MAG: hypothetical protein RLZZ450_5738 [Pseudomonadota bacterium]|jgi:hypothetical protein
MRNRDDDCVHTPVRHSVGLVALCAALSISQFAHAQSRTAEPSDSEREKELPEAEDAEAEEEANEKGTVPPKVVITTGAPQPPGQNLASPLPATATAAPAVVRVGGGAILIYSNNYAPKYDQAGNKKKNYFDAWRASIVLDSKVERYGTHIEFRVRDRGLRWMPTNAWLEECYASADVIAMPSNFPLTAKLGKSYEMFGRVWDNSFYGSIPFRDGLKLDPNWGLSLEGALGALKPIGTRYFAQYYMLDGATSTAATNRDTISQVVPGTANTTTGVRRRERLIGRIEPFIKLAPDIVFRLGASIDHFTVDAPDTASAADMAQMWRQKSNDNTSKVTRVGFDLTAQVKWFSAWAEYAHQSGYHVTAFPIPPRADNPATMESEARAGRSSNDITYLMGGGNFVWTRYTIQYNYSSGLYKNVRAIDVAGMPVGQHKEWIHNPSIQVAVNDQIKLIFEAPIWKREALGGLLPIDPKVKGLTKQGQLETVEKQILLTLHSRF